MTKLALVVLATALALVGPIGCMLYNVQPGGTGGGPGGRPSEDSSGGSPWPDMSQNSVGDGTTGAGGMAGSSGSGSGWSGT